MFKKPADDELNAKVEAELKLFEELTNEIDEGYKNNTHFETQLIQYMIDNEISELTIGDTVVTLEVEPELDIEKMKEDGVYEEYSQAETEPNND